MAARPEHIRRRAAALGVGILGVAGIVMAVDSPDPSSGDGPSDRAVAALAAQSKPATLPDGTRSILPEHRVYAHYGAPQAKALGILGIGTPSEAGRRLVRQSKSYAGPQRLPVLPAMELIAVIASNSPGADGKWRTRQSDATIQRYLEAARANNAILILDIQPGRSDFLTEVKALSRFLIEPDVSIALDPEWRMAPGQVPGRVIGSVQAAELNRTTEWLDKLIKKRDLPDKLVILHQFTDGMIRDRANLLPRKHLDIVLNADGFGTGPLKQATYTRVVRNRGPLYAGFKLFYEEDTGLMTPGQVLRLRPRPLVVMYE